MEFLELAKERYSCRKFSDKKVEQEKLDKILEAAIAAPTAVNRQPVKIWVMQSAGAKSRIHQVTDYTFGADTFLVVGGSAGEAWVRRYDGCNFSEVDAAIVATHIMLEVKDLGLDTTWVGSFDAPLLKTLCPEMADYDLIAIFPIGYAAEDEAAKPSVRHTLRKSRGELTEVL